MGKNETLRNWGIIVAVLIATSALTAVWPALTSSLVGGSGGAGAPPLQAEQVELATVPVIGPTLVESLGMESVSSFAIVAVMGALFIGAPIGIGVAIALGYRFLDTFIRREKESDAFKEGERSMDQYLKNKLKEMNEGRKPHGRPDHDRPVWSAWATSLIFIMFAIFFALMVMRTFFPENELISGEQIFNVAGLTTWIVGIVTALFLFWWMRPARDVEAKKPAAVVESEGPAIPWDMIIVILTGLLVVGLGIGFAVYLTVPV